MIPEVQSLNPGGLVTFLEIDFSTCVGFKPTISPSTLKFCSHKNGSSYTLVYNSVTYDYIGFEIDGLSTELGGQAPQPRITFDKAGLYRLTAFLNLWDNAAGQTGDFYFDWRGAKVKLYRVLNLTVAQQLNIQEYVVEQIAKEDSNSVEVQLAVSLGIEKANSDSIQKLAVNRCALRYRRWDTTSSSFKYTDELAGGCPYGNPTTTSNWSAVPSFGVLYFNSSDVATTNNLDKCSYSVKGCRQRFDPASTGLALPFVGLYSPNTIGKK